MVSAHGDCFPCECALAVGSVHIPVAGLRRVFLYTPAVVLVLGGQPLDITIIVAERGTSAA